MLYHLVFWNLKLGQVLGEWFQQAAKHPSASGRNHSVVQVFRCLISDLPVQYPGANIPGCKPGDAVYYQEQKKLKN